MNLLSQAAQRVDQAEVFGTNTETVPVSFEAGDLDSVKSVSSAGRALRVIHQGRLGFSTTTDLEDTDAVVSRALESAQYGDQANFNFAPREEVSSTDTYDRDIDDLTVEELIDQGRSIIDTIEEYDPDIQVDVDLVKDVSQINFSNTSDLELSEQRSKISVQIQVQRVQEGDIFTLYLDDAARNLDRLDPIKLAEQVVTRLRWAETTTTVSSGKQPVVFTPQGTLVLLVPIILGFNGKNVYLGSSPLEGAIGEQRFDQRLSLIDDPESDASSRTQSFDDEGVPTRKKPLIDAGTVSQFLYDLKTAAQASTESTGNGYKAGLMSGNDFRTTPHVGPAALRLQGGDYRMGQLIKEVGNGILVDQVLGLGQGNVISGEFSNNVSVAYKIEGGSVTGRIKNTMIAGNVYDLLQDQLFGLGDVPEWVHGTLQAPPVAVDGVNVVHEE